jgi:hypothetical protein
MRTTKVLSILTTVIAAGLLVLATTSNTVFALSITGDPTGSSTSATSFISQTNDQSNLCVAGTTNTNSCNQSASNLNSGNALSGASASDPNGGSSSNSGISQSNTQKAACIAGTSNTDSCNQAALNVNKGNAVSAASASDPSGGGSSGATSGISQSNVQNAFCIAGTSNSGSCNQAASNFNFGNAVSVALTR